MLMSRAFIIPGLDWVVSASEGEMLEYLGEEVVCPRCGSLLRQDPHLASPALADDGGHNYSNVRALVVELYQRGLLLPKMPALHRSSMFRHSAA